MDIENICTYSVNMYKFIILLAVLFLMGGCFTKKWKQKSDVVHNLIEREGERNDEKKV